MTREVLLLVSYIEASLVRELDIRVKVWTG